MPILDQTRMFMKQVLAFLLLHLLHVGIVQAQASHLERILAANELRVCIWTDYSPLDTAAPTARRHMLDSIAVRD